MPQHYFEMSENYQKNLVVYSHSKLANNISSGLPEGEKFFTVCVLTEHTKGLLVRLGTLFFVKRPHIETEVLVDIMKI